MSTMDSNSSDDHHYGDDEDVPLPGFRFHPTDEELIEFYLHRKIEKKPISLELIKSINIYKHDPWDLPKANTAGDREWYFFCKRGRKYKNSIRPNRVTGSGFWKATGIDKPIHSHGGQGRACIGLKKTLVYYRGSAGKGTKTDWMMHEFRRPNPNSFKNVNSTDPQQEAEIWTLCRIFKRNVSYKKHIPDWGESSASKRHQVDSLSSKKCTTDQDSNDGESYINFGASNSPILYEERKPVVNHMMTGFHGNHNINHQQSLPASAATSHPYMASLANFTYQDIEDDLFTDNWDELRSVAQLAFDPTFVM